jgi:hypothetical protein
MQNTNLEIMLKDKVKELGEFLIEICLDETKKRDIKDTLIDLPMYKLLMFISFLDTNKVDHQIDDFVRLFKLDNTEDNRTKIKDHIQFFISVKEILNE